MPYNPYDWYWLAADDRLLSSSRSRLVPLNDATYLAWLAAGNVATSWPKDAAGVQTTAALQEVLTPYNLFASLTAYAAYKRWQKETGGIVVSGVPIATDDRSKLMVTGGRIAADADPAWTTKWVGSDGNVYTVNVAAMIAISDAVQTLVNSCFDEYAIVLAGIVGATITTRAQVDGGFA